MFSIIGDGVVLETVPRDGVQFALEAWQGMGYAKLEAKELTTQAEFRSVEDIAMEKEWAKVEG